MLERRRTWRCALVAICLFVLAACETPPMYTAISYSQVGDPQVTVDPTTGNRKRITHWRYADGYMTVTVEEIPVGAGNEFRRNPEPPPLRLAD